MRAFDRDGADGGQHFPAAAPLEADGAGARTETRRPFFCSAASTRLGGLL